ncbi:hypothetical protein KXD93_24300 [Mucilaginibacter sp. BJC16-A38]|uniref:hypothetical protein n=1 Tax=Mucilaginibacter phenanthrenivorans TaxID=1234842 RepID=UPI0021570FB0|nr:hypothetical protein [Mucilaginibacter phenanthrenivorans]MCR8560801.1 hypothetical protein [Mucilaginibacter phenanthrenivorans]
MKTILVINDNSAGVVNAAKLAFFIAQETHANIVLANTFKLNNPFAEKAIAGNTASGQDDLLMTNLGEYLDALNDRPNDFEPAIDEMDTSAMDVHQLAQMINQRDIWMIVKGAAEPLSSESYINFNTLLTRVRCPLLLVPETWSLKNIERLVYLADLPYCRLQIVRYLAGLAKLWHADLSIAHLSKEELVGMDKDFDDEVPDDEIRNKVSYDQLFFNNIPEGNLNTAVDVLINGMHNDFLVMAQHHFRCMGLVGPYVAGGLPPHITVPLLIFPS